jgi:hypothetical protein
MFFVVFENAGLAHATAGFVSASGTHLVLGGSNFMGAGTTNGFQYWNGTGPATATGCWNQTTYTLVVQRGTNYVKITFPNFSAYNWNPELGQATFVAPAQ